MTEAERMKRTERAIAQLAKLTARAAGAIMAHREPELAAIYAEVQAEEELERREREREEVLTHYGVNSSSRLETPKENQ